MKISLYIACSLDGYIAKPDGDIEWLSMVEDAAEDYGYNDYYASIDATVMGGNTYEDILGFGDWPYKDKSSYVMTRRKLPNNPQHTTLFNGDVKQMHQMLIDQQHQHVWLVGGGKLITHFFQADLIDSYIISIIPILLGQGIPLFRTNNHSSKLKLTHTQAYASGLVQLHYLPLR